MTAASSANSRDIDPSDGRKETAAERSDRNWSEILQELRITQTGTQIISAFLLAVAFQQRFPQLRPYQLSIYGVLVSLAAASTLMGLTVVSLHRAQFHRHDKPEVVTRAHRTLIASVWIVALLTAGVVLFIFDFVFGPLAGILAGTVALLAVIWLLFVIPRSINRNQTR